MRKLFTIAILLCVTALSDDRAGFYINNFTRHSRNIEQISDRTDFAISSILKVAYLNLKSRGYVDEANELRGGWTLYKGLLPSLVRKKSRDIGDYAPMFQFLDVMETRIEKVLGYKLASSLRITDLKTLNFGIRHIFFNACQGGLYQFTAHFCGDIHVNPASTHPYRGLLPVVAYWSISGTCSVGTAGLFFAFVCTPVAAISEWAIDGGLAPWIAPKIYYSVCDNN